MATSGSEAIPERRTLTGKRLTYLDLDNRVLGFDDGTRYTYDRLASAIPLPELARATTQAAGLAEDVAKLAWTSMSLVSVGFSRPDVAQWLWFYITDPEILAIWSVEP